MKRKIGIIGLGFIGFEYASKLLNGGYSLTVLDCDAEKQRKVVSLGAIGATTPAQVAKNSDIVLLALPNSEIVEATMGGKNGVLSALDRGKLVIDTSSCRPQTSVLLDALCREKGAGFLDAPLTRKAKGHILMVSGSKEDFAIAEEIFGCISYKYQRVGEAGAGQTLKKIQQGIGAGLLAVYAENIELTKSCGLDPKLLRELLEFDIPDSLYTEDYAGGGNLWMNYKDLGYLMEIAHDKCANVPLSALVHEIFKAVRISGEPDWIQAGIQTYYRKLNTTKRTTLKKRTITHGER